MTALEVAVRTKNPTMVRMLAEAGADVNVAVGDGSNLLELAARRRSDEIVKILQAHGARYPESMDQTEKGALLVAPGILSAARGGNFEEALRQLETLLDNEARSINAGLLFNIAAQDNQASVVGQILGKYEQLDLNEAFVAAAENGNGDLLKLLIETENKRQGEFSADHLERALRAAVRNGDKVTMKLLTKRYPLSKCSPDLGERLLVLASVYGQPNLADELMGYAFEKAENRLTWAGMRVLHAAVQNKNVKTVNALLKHGNLSEESLFPFEDSIMMIIAGRNDIDLAKRLIDKGIDVNATGRNGMTALMTAAK